ncbi:hypothetical protein ACH5RR_029165 [Cinchona calisaya]|uniref:S-acyltransferase n=1 Tax=Cinchona calisaya TaxID=153742 RepID=A0ABD2YSJ8_9GENT
MEGEQKDNSVIDCAMETIDISSSLEIDQFSEVFSNENMNKTSEVELHFLSNTKKVLISVWGKIIRFNRVVQDHCIRIFCSEEIERTRVYHVWPGNNVLINLAFVSIIDPGIIPRNYQNSSVELSTNSNNTNRRRYRVITINGIEVKLKYCRICNIYRPPRSCHCAVCNNCIERFDHHCPWIGHCIGLRNYRLYLMFLSTGLLLFAFIFIFSCKIVHHKLSGDGIGVIILLRNCPETLALTVLSFAAMSFLAGLSCYHVQLIAINQTAYEHFHQKYVSSRNPFNKEVLNNIKEVLLSSQPPARVNFLADVEPGWFGG